MFGPEALNQVQQRKAALVTRSATLRQELAEATVPLRRAAAWADLGLSVAEPVRAALAAGRGRARPAPGVASLVHRFAEALALARTLLACWRSGA